MEKVHQYIGNKIKAFRTAYGLTQQELADKTGISRATIGNIETGTDPATLSNCYVISEAFKIDVYDLIPPKK